MSDKSAIEWTDATWNPVRGCDEISPGCDYCYARVFAERFRGVPGHPYEQGFDIRTAPDKLKEPLSWQRPRRVFVNSMSDLFHARVPFDYIDRCAAVMALSPWHTYQVLTKRSTRLLAYLSALTFERLVAAANLDALGVEASPGSPTLTTIAHRTKERRFMDGDKAALARRMEHPPLSNVWWGVSVENRKHGLPRIEHLRNAPAALRFLSIEPLLEDLGVIDLTGISWVIVGGESGHGARPMHPDWVRSLRDQCIAAGVPFFFKQWGAWMPRDTVNVSRRHVVFENGAPREVRDWVACLPFAKTGDYIERVGKKGGGRLLDGRTWDEFPEVANV